MLRQNHWRGRVGCRFALSALLALGGLSGPLAAQEQGESEAASGAVADPPMEAAEPLPVIPVAAETEPARVVEEPDGAVALDEIVVTATKRGVQAVKDIPVSISVVDDQLIYDWGITDVREAMLFVPNVKVEQAGFFASPRVRGFSFNNNNKAFEPPAGIAMEGVPYGRVEYFAAGLFDTERIEVLRGPQGTTFGKNTTAGLINVLSKDPGDVFSGFVDLQGGEYDRRRIEAGVGGPLIDGVANFRIAGISDERRGFVYNTTSEIVPEADRLLRGDLRDGFRLKLAFPDLFASSAKITYESVDLESLGTGVEIVRASENIQARLREYDPNADFIPANFVSSIDSPDGRKTQLDSWVLDWTRALGLWSVTALGGYSTMKTQLSADVDFTPAKAIFAESQDRSPTTTAELRLLSPGFTGLLGLPTLLGADLGSSDLLLGFFYQDTGIEDSLLRFHFNPGPIADIEGNARTPGQGDGSTGLIGGGLPALPQDIAGLGAEQSSQYFELASRTLALFAQTQWQFLPQWALQLGGRFSREKRSAQWQQVFDSDTSVLMESQGLREFVADEALQEDHFQPKVSINWQPASNLSFFVHWARAFKGGGFNAFAFRGEHEELVYRPEFSTEWGADLKSTFFGRTLQLNLSLYRMDIDDFQVLTRVPQTSQLGLGVSKVENAATARAQGLEGDFTWLAASWLRLMVTAGFNDTEYLDFKTNDCPADMPNTDGDDDNRCDASGRSFAFAPRLNGTVGASITPQIDLFGSTLNVGVVAEYQDRQYLDIDLDERKVQEAYWRLRASIGLAGHGGWSFKLIGENLNNVKSYIRMGDVTPGIFVGGLEPPRMIFGQFRYTF